MVVLASAGGPLSNGKAEVHDSFSSEAAFTAAYADSGKGGGGFQPGAPPPGVLKEIDMQEVNRIYVRSDRLNRCQHGPSPDSGDRGPASHSITTQVHGTQTSVLCSCAALRRAYLHAI